MIDQPLLRKKQDPYTDKFEYLEQLIQGQARILEMIAKGEDLKEILNAIVLWAEKESRDGVLASILLTNYNGERLLHGAAPSLPEDYNNAIHGIEIGPAVGSCGTAAYTRQQVIVEDISTDPLWKDFRDLALKYDLRACWSTPLTRKDGSVIGTFGMYYHEPKKPSEQDLQVINLIAYTTVIAIEWGRTAEEKRLMLENEKKAAHRLREEWESFNSLLMDAPAMVAILKGPDHIYELANPLYMEAIGPSRTVLGKPIREALPELAGQGIYELLDEVYRSGNPYFGNELLVQLDRTGKTTLENAYFNFTYQPIKNGRGEVEGIFVHAVNVTELVVARKRAEESEQRFKSFVLNSPKPIGIYVGREMRIQTANDAILKAWEKDRSVIGKTFREALPELEGQPFYDLLDRVYTTGVPYQAIEERVYLYRDGKITPTYWNFDYTPLRNEDGEIYGVMNTGTEVTDLVTAKKNLLAAEEALRSAIDIAELGTWSIDVSTGYVTYDDPVVRWFGLPAEGATLDTVISRIHEDVRERVSKAIEDALESKGIYETEYRVTNPFTGREKVLHAKGKVVTDESGNVTLLNGICRDITLQKETEKELTRKVELRTFELQKANAELNSLNENLKQFVYVASHDLQEPLRKINIFSDLVKNGQDQNRLTPQQQNYLSKITKAAGRMTHLIRDLLNFSRAESDSNFSEEVDLGRIVRNVIEDYEVLIEQKDASIEAGDLPVIPGNALQMNQLFYNLIGNALKFSKEGRKPVISITSKGLPASAAADYGLPDPRLPYTEIVVSDNGIGFEQKFAEQIFIIFQRLHGKYEYEGTGIGLALCKRIAENHQGIIFARGTSDQGAAFHIVLPLRRQS